MTRGVFQLRCHDGQRAGWAAAAAGRGLSLSEWVRGVLDREAGSAASSEKAEAMYSRVDLEPAVVVREITAGERNLIGRVVEGDQLDRDLAYRSVTPVPRAGAR